MWGIYLAAVINLVLIGAWHGANWTYVLFGLYHGFLIAIVTATEKKRKKFEKKHDLKKNEIWKWSRRLLTFCLFVIGSVLFRSASVGDFFGTMAQIGSGFGPVFNEGFLYILGYACPSICIVILKEWKDEYGKEFHFLHSKKIWLRILTIVILIITIILIAEVDGGSFIYFQF